jgi:uncharacterized membrane protein YqaE (UPF0057 family)
VGRARVHHADSLTANPAIGGCDAPSGEPLHAVRYHDSDPATHAMPFLWERTMDILRIILAIILPPLGVFLQVGIGLHFWLNILLTLLGYIPGIIHAIWVIVTK